MISKLNHITSCYSWCTIFKKIFFFAFWLITSCAFFIRVWVKVNAVILLRLLLVCCGSAVTGPWCLTCKWNVEFIYSYNCYSYILNVCLWDLELKMPSSCTPGSSWCCWARPPSPSQTHLRWRTRSPPSDTLWSASSSAPGSRSEEYPAHPQNWRKTLSQSDLWRAFMMLMFKEMLLNNHVY